MKDKSIKEKAKRFFSETDIDLGSDFYIEMRGEHNLSVRGCVGIAEYGSERIGLHLSRGILNIDGRELLCDSYLNGAVLIRGEICAIELVKRQKEAK